MYNINCNVICAVSIFRNNVNNTIAGFGITKCKIMCRNKNANTSYIELSCFGPFVFVTMQHICYAKPFIWICTNLAGTDRARYLNSIKPG